MYSPPGNTVCALSIGKIKYWQISFSPKSGSQKTMAKLIWQRGPWIWVSQVQTWNSIGKFIFAYMFLLHFFSNQTLNHVKSNQEYQTCWGLLAKPVYGPSKPNCWLYPCNQVQGHGTVLHFLKFKPDSIQAPNELFCA